MWVGAYNSVVSYRRIIEQYGLQQFRHSFRMQIDMDSPPPTPSWPQGIAVRMANPEQEIEVIYMVDDEAFLDHYGYISEPHDEGFERYKHMFLEDEGYDPSLWFLTMDGEDIAGLCLGRNSSYEDKDSGYIHSLGVRRPWRSRGIGLALLHQAFGEYYRRGKRKVALGVDAENLTGALDLYKKAGMYIHRQFDLYQKILRPGEEISVESLNR